MAFNVYFYTFQKRLNSTKVVTDGSASVTLSCRLKDNTDIINPTIEISGKDSTFNPWNLNYCWVTKFNRYYFINTWRYNVGVWECECTVDILATVKNQIGAKTKYVLRSASKYNRNIVDTFYPSLAWQPNYYIDTADFQFYRQVSQGSFILGLANRDNSGFGAISYYVLSSQAIKNLVRTMLPTASETWGQSFTGLTDTLYRSLYDPFNYIKSCKWFPISVQSDGGDPVALTFGNYASSVYGNHLPNNIDNWFSNYRDVSLPSGFLSFDAKHRVSPYCHIYLVLNPWGIIELNPNDFTDSITIRLRIYADYISGEGILKIYKVVSSTEYFITQRRAKISVDVDLTQTSIDFGGIISGSLGAVGGAVLAAGTGNVAGLVAGIAAGENGIISATESAIPTIAGSIGQSFDNVRSMDGVATLIYQDTYFAEEDNAENGKPLCENTVLNTLSGYIKCLDGDIDIAGCMKQELEMINDFLTSGFYYE